MAFLIVFVVMMILISSGDFNEIESVCEELLNKRNTIWNKIFDGSYSVENFEDDIKSVARGELFLEDIEAYKYLCDNPTDMEKVVSLKLYSGKVEKVNSGYIIEGSILWNIESQEGLESISYKYYIEMEKYKGNWYLTSINPIEQKRH